MIPDIVCLWVSFFLAQCAWWELEIKRLTLTQAQGFAGAQGLWLAV
jgi:hypothetical protein